MKHTSFLFLYLLILFSCSHKASEATIEEKEKPNQVVIFFKNPSSNSAYEIPGTDGKKVRNFFAEQGLPIEGIDDKNLVQYYGFDEHKEYDTLIIPTQRDIIELKFAYKAIDRLTFYFQNGDSVFIEYKDSKPYATVLNRNEDFEVTNFQLFRRDSIHKVDFLASDKYSDPSHYINEWMREIEKTGERIDLKAFRKTFKENQIENTLSQFETDKHYLDSLQKEGLISLTTKKAIINDFYWGIKMAIEPDKFTQIESSQKLILLLKQIEEQYPEVNARNDSLLNSISYQKFFRKIPITEFKPEILEIKSEQAASKINNYVSLYDSIRESELFTPSERLVLQFSNVDQILQNTSFFGIEDRLKYLTKFKNDFQDTVLFNVLVKKYNVKFEIDDEIKLVDIDGNETTFQAFLEANTNNLVYVDFWASWCAPCLREMPSSQSLQTDLKDENITFLYLSTDRKEDPWKNAVDKHELKTGQHFRILNGDNSIAMNELQIQFIPRYMIYHKGQLVNKDAPRPSDKEKLIAEFNRYLANQ
ncbi:MAG: TlpA family protein disulfide reductase [Cytophagia bacterium]|nr:TlpA family protein disulfide reductase [Cytophagia bacterium]